MKNLAIVAIPSIDDPVWRYSSEEVPHLTILYLGDQPDSLNTKSMEEFIGHVVNTSMYRFGMSVENRGTLGDKNADVLFFDKDYCSEMLENARAYFLADPEIKNAYRSTTKYPEWIPHLTMGYPETPAKKDERDYPGINWVNFDRIAFWTGDYEGPEYKLKAANGLNHYGVKGMHWGVTRGETKLQADHIPDTKTSSGHSLSFEPSKTPLLARGIAAISSRFREKLNQGDGYDLKDSEGKIVGELSLHKESPTSMNVVWVGVKDDQRGKGYATAAMRSAIAKAKKDKMEQVTLEVPGNSPDALHIYKKLGFKLDGRDSGEPDDIWGGLTGMTLRLKKSATHSENIENFLEHYGIKGMKWGVTRDNIGSIASAVKKASPAAKAGIEALGSRYTPDATKAAFNQRVASKGGLHRVSDKDLQAMLNRMNMEQNYSRFMQQEEARRSAGQKSAIKFLFEAGKLAVPIIGGMVGGPVGSAAGSAAARAASTVANSVLERGGSLED